VVVPVSLSLVSTPAHAGYPGSKGCEMVVHSLLLLLTCTEY